MTTTEAITTGITTDPALTPYLTVHDGAGALAFYGKALGAQVGDRIVGPDGTIGHATFHIGTARFYLSDENPELGVLSPRSLGGSAVMLHLTVDDVDASFARAITAGATSLREPADQPHGARQGTFTDPYGHRWMLSQPIEALSQSELTERMSDAGYTVQSAGRPAAMRTAGGGIWAAIHSEDATEMIRFVTEVLGFEEELVVPGAEPGVVEHSQFRWPEGGTLQVGSAHRPGSVFSEQPVGGQSLYLITGNPDAVYQRCVDADVEVIVEPYSPDYDPGGTGFAIRDHEGNLWSFGTYAGE